MMQPEKSLADYVWIKRENFASQKRMEKLWTKLTGSLLATTFPHIFTPYPYSTENGNGRIQVPAAQQLDFLSKMIFKRMSKTLIELDKLFS